MNSNPRKRPAPGSAPIPVPMPMPQMQHRFPSPTNTTTNNDLTRWHDSSTGFVDGTSQAVNPYGMMPTPQQQPQPYGQAPVPNANNTLARRQMNRALVPTTARANFDNAGEPWPFVTDDSALLQAQQQQQPNEGQVEDIETLEERAQKAKRDAQAKRKQIPPFVQKLSSFLDEEKNVELIRWSDNGDSFVVLDEDEFAKTLIPELFKHNNYASFVRQLNMYGFHKRVGLSDNSMRASERKNKSPSEYSNPYFKRGHPNLLWLISKPKSGGKGKSKAGTKQPEGEVESDDDIGVEEIIPQGIGTSNPQNTRALPAGGNTPLDKKEMTLVREELSKVREQQKMILNAIGRIQRDNTNLYQQAVIFQEQHDRHQNSINAILNFLANVFRKTLEDQNGSQNVNELLSNIIPGGGSGAMPQGSVVDLGDFMSQVPGASPMSTHKRTRGLLPPIPDNSIGGRASTVASSTPSTSAATPQSFNRHINQEPGTVTELFDNFDMPENSNASPDMLAQELKSNPHASMMKIIQDTNANRASGLDLPEVVANTPTTMTNDQREQMLNNMMAQTSAPDSNTIPATNNINNPSANAPYRTHRKTPPTTHSHGPSSSRTAPTGPLPPQPPPPSASANNEGNFSLSPIMGSNPPPPSLSHINSNSNELDTLQRMSQDSNDRLANIQNILSPLSPSGRIPGLEDMDGNGGYFDNSNLDIDQFLDSDAFDPSSNFPNIDFGASGTGGEFDFGMLHDPPAGGDANLGVGDRVAEAGSTANNTPSPSGTEEIPRGDLGVVGDGSPRGSKRRRVG